MTSMPILSRRHAAPLLFLLLGACASDRSIEAVKAPEDETILLSVDLHRDHGWAALRAERHDEAHDYFQRVLRDRDGDLDARLGLGEALLGQGRMDDAFAQFKAVADEAPRLLQAKALQGQGIVWLRRGRHVEAEAPLDKAIDLEPKLWRAWNGVGRLRDARKDYVAARYAYRKAIDINPKNPLLHNNLGFSLLSSGDPAYAESMFRRALDLDPEMEVAAANLRLALALQGRYASAMAGAPAGDKARIMNNVGYAALLRGDLERARGLFLEAMEVDPGFFEEARLNLAFLETLEAEQ